jgi:hydroxyethylthiazole kinase
MNEDIASKIAEHEDYMENNEVLVRPRKAPPARLVVSSKDMLKTAADALVELKEKKPLVHCLTNYVAANLTVNVLLALGARTCIVDDQTEVTQSPCNSLLVNVGSLTKSQGDAMRAAVARANQSARAWVLDPVSIGKLPMRTYLAKELMRRFPGLIRGNEMELLELTGIELPGSDIPSLPSEKIRVEFARLAAITRSAILFSGENDLVFSENAPIAEIEGCGKYASAVAGFTSAQSAVGAALLANLTKAKRFEAACATSLVFSVAAKIANSKVNGPASFQVAFLDALYNLKPDDIIKLGKIKILD